MSATFLYEAHIIAITGIAPNRSPTAGGVAIQITGRGFAGLTSAADPIVTLDGGAPLTLIEWGDGYIQASAPPHGPGTVDLVVENADGESATVTAGFAYADTHPPIDLVFRSPSGGASTIARTENAPARITQTLGQPSAASFTSPLEPHGLDSVTWRAFGQVLFDGVITRAVARTEGREKDTVWDCAALDFSHLLAKAYPVVEWTSTPADAVIAALVSSYAPGFRAVVESGLPPVTIQLDGGRDLWAVIVDVCEKAGAHAMLASTTIYVFTEINPFDPPAAVTDANPDLLWPDQGQAVTIDTDYAQLANSVTVRGAEGISALVEDASSIAQFGRCPLPIFDNALTTAAECVSRAQAVVDAHAWPVPTVSYATRDLKTMAGKTVAINISAPPIDETWLIQSVSIDQLENLAVGERPRFLVTAVPPWAPAEQRADPTARILQEAIDVAASVDKQPRLDGDITAAPGGRTTIPPGSVAATKLAGCIGSDLLVETGVDPGSYGATEALELAGAPRALVGNHKLIGFTVDAAGRITAAAEDPIPAVKVDGAEPYIADQPMGGHKLTGVGAPTAAADATTKQYVDDAIAASGGGSGAIHADGSVDFTADQSMAGHRIFDAGDPVDPQDYTTKSYVDDAIAAGSGGAGVVGEVPSGAINGVNAVFTTAAAYGDGLAVYLNGVRQQIASDYTETSATTFTFGAAPLAGDVVLVDYGGASGGGSGGGDIKSDGSVPFAAAQSMGAHALTNVADPSAAQDAATRAYVDAAIAAIPAPSSGGLVKQVVAFQTGAVATGSTIIPFDDTIPQSGEGTQFMSLTITPQDAANILDITVMAFVTVTATPWIIVALFQDAIANARAVVATFNNLNTAGATIPMRFAMVAGATTPLTFKVRIGPSGVATVTFNGQSGGRIFGGVAVSSIQITERTP